MPSHNWMRFLGQMAGRLELSALLGVAIAVFTTPFISNELGPAYRGVFFTVLGLGHFAPVVFGVGLPQLVRRSQARGEFGIPVFVRKIGLTGLSLALVFLVILALRPSQISEQYIFWFFFLVICLIQFSNIVMISALMGQRRYSAAVMQNVSMPFSHAAALMISSFLGANLLTLLLIGSLVGLTLVFVYAFSQLQACFGLPLQRTENSKSRILVWIVSLVAPGSGRLEAALFLVMFSASISGEYTLAVSLTIPAMAFHSGVVSKFYAAFANNTMTSSKLKAQLFGYWAWLLAVGLIMYPIGWIYIEVFISEQFSEAQTILLLVVLSRAFLLPALVNIDLLVASKREKPLFWSLLASIFVSILVLVLVAYSGYVAILWSSLAFGVSLLAATMFLILSGTANPSQISGTKSD